MYVCTNAEARDLPPGLANSLYDIVLEVAEVVIYLSARWPDEYRACPHSRVQGCPIRGLDRNRCSATTEEPLGVEDVS